MRVPTVLPTTSNSAAFHRSAFMTSSSASSNTQYSRAEGRERLTAIVASLAYAEGLQGHAMLLKPADKKIKLSCYETS